MGEYLDLIKDYKEPRSQTDFVIQAKRLLATQEREEISPVVRRRDVGITHYSTRSLEFRKRLKLVRKRTGHVYRFKCWKEFPPPVVWERQPDGEFRCLKPWEVLAQKAAKNPGKTSKQIT